MRLHTLKPAAGSVKSTKRIARGTGSGHGGTSTRGHKGAKSRSGNSFKRGFEGGQMPLQRRTPKRGFKNVNRVDYIPLNLDRLEALATKHGVDTFDVVKLHELNVVGKSDRVKILANNEGFATKLNISAHAFSAKAKEVIEAAGGTVTIIE